jgi:SAM-dependent methyltransferase
MRDLTDAPFYVDLAQESGGPVLEIGCGTGRVLLATARAGISIHGVDNSAPMLAVLREHIARESARVQNNITLHAGDMRDFRLNRKFSLVTIPFRPMQHMFTISDQLRALTSAAAHVAEGGILFLSKNRPVASSHRGRAAGSGVVSAFTARNRDSSLCSHRIRGQDCPELRADILLSDLSQRANDRRGNRHAQNVVLHLPPSASTILTGGT